MWKHISCHCCYCIHYMNKLNSKTSLLKEITAQEEDDNDIKFKEKSPNVEESNEIQNDVSNI